MKRIAFFAVVLLAITACATATAPKQDGGCPPGYIMSTGDKCVPH